MHHAVSVDGKACRDRAIADNNEAIIKIYVVNNVILILIDKNGFVFFNNS